MYQLTMYLGEKVDETPLAVKVGDVPVLEVTALDASGADWPDDYTATLVVRRSERDSTDQIEIAMDTEATPLDVDNIYYFHLTEMTFEPGNYEAHLVVESDDPTPDVYSFETFSIEVTA